MGDCSYESSTNDQQRANNSSEGVDSHERQALLEKG